MRSLEKQLTQLWRDYLHSMKSTDVEDCLSLEHLGLILQHLARSSEYNLVVLSYSLCVGDIYGNKGHMYLNSLYYVVLKILKESSLFCKLIR